MKTILATSAIIALFVFLKVIRFGIKGGTFTQVAENVSYLYYQAKRVYENMPENFARFMSIWLNTAGCRELFSEAEIYKFVTTHEDYEWKDVCLDYSWRFAAMTGAPSRFEVPSNVRNDMDSKTFKVIDDVRRKVERGRIRKREEYVLRNIPQHVIENAMSKITCPD